MALLFVALVASVVAASSLPKFALDTDIGTDFDDMWAMTYLLSRSIPDDPNRELDFLLVQCSTYNTTDRARIAAKAMYDLRRFDVPISVGLYTGEQHMPQLPAAAGFELSDFVAAGGTIYYGESYLAGLMAAATPSDPLFVVEIAPVTSLGGILEQTPALSANVITTAMSGPVYHGYGNSSQPDREYNVVQNITASQAMYAASWLSPLMMVPLDTSGLLHCQGPEWGALIAANTSSHPYAEVLLRNYQIWCNCTPTPSGESDTLYDAQAAWQSGYYAANWVPHGTTPPQIPAILQQELPIVVNASGFTVINATGQTVWSAVGFPVGLMNTTHTVCIALIDSIISAASNKMQVQH